MRILERLPKLRTLSLPSTAAGLLLADRLLAARPHRACHTRGPGDPGASHAQTLSSQSSSAGPAHSHGRVTSERQHPPGPQGRKYQRPPRASCPHPRVTAPPLPSCGVRGRPPCTTGAKTAGPTIVTPPPPPGCKGSHCPPPPICRGSRCPPPDGPGVIVTPPPSGGGGFGASYFAALPRVAEGARDPYAGPALSPSRCSY